MERIGQPDIGWVLVSAAAMAGLFLALSAREQLIELFDACSPHLWDRVFIKLGRQNLTAVEVTGSRPALVDAGQCVKCGAQVSPQFSGSIENGLCSHCGTQPATTEGHSSVEAPVPCNVELGESPLGRGWGSVPVNRCDVVPGDALEPAGLGAVQRPPELEIISFDCWACRNPINIGIEHAGKTGACLQCGQRLRIPHPDQLQVLQPAGSVIEADSGSPQADYGRSQSVLNARRSRTTRAPLQLMAVCVIGAVVIIGGILSSLSGMPGMALGVRQVSSGEDGQVGVKQSPDYAPQERKYSDRDVMEVVSGLVGAGDGSDWKELLDEWSGDASPSVPQFTLTGESKLGERSTVEDRLGPADESESGVITRSFGQPGSGAVRTVTDDVSWLTYRWVRFAVNERDEILGIEFVVARYGEAQRRSR